MGLYEIESGKEGNKKVKKHLRRLWG